MPPIVYEIFDLISSFIRLIGLALFGLGIGWIALDLLRKSQAWQLQIAVFLGLAGLMIGLTYFLSWGALGAFGICFGIAVLLWGLPKKKKEEAEK